jgi:hypothetical protein
LLFDVTVLNEQESTWVNEAAQRLRLIQAEAAVSTPEQRREFLREEITRTLEGVPVSNRKRYLEALLARFPVRGETARLSATPQLPQPPAPPAPQNPEELLDAFLSRATGLGDERRTALAKKIGEAGFTWVDRAALELEVADEFRRALGLPGDKQPRLTRLVQLTLLLIDLCYRLDNTALKTLGELSPRSSLLTRPQDFREAVASFLTATSDSVEPQIRSISGLVGGLLAALLGAGRDYGRQYVERFSPAAIEDVIKGEGKGSWWVPGRPTEKELCWDKFKDLAKDFATAELIDRRIKDCLATFVEKKVLAGR